MARHLFLAGCILMILFAGGHFAGFLAARHAARHDPALADLTAAMRSHQANVMGFRPSVLDFREYFSVNFSVLLTLAAGLDLLALRLAADARHAPSGVGARLRPVALANLVGFAVLLGLSVAYSVLQGIISCGVIAAVFAGAAWPNQPPRETAGT